MFDNKPVELVRGTLGSIGGVGMEVEEVSPEERQAFYEQIWSEPGFKIWGRVSDVLITGYKLLIFNVF